MVKLHDTKFYCCNALKLDYDVYNDECVEAPNTILSIEDYCRIEEIKYCKHCGNKIR